MDHQELSEVDYNLSLNPTQLTLFVFGVLLVTQSCSTLCDPIALQAPLSMGFSRQKYWAGFPFPSPGYLPNPWIKPGSPALQTLYHLGHQGSTVSMSLEDAGFVGLLHGHCNVLLVCIPVQ